MIKLIMATAKKRSKVQGCTIYVGQTQYGPKVFLWNDGTVDVLFKFKNGKKVKK